MSLDDAADIVRLEFQKHDIRVDEKYARDVARTFHRGLGWPLRHPIKARREGYRFQIWSRD